jgi:hypothetical protein
MDDWSSFSSPVDDWASFSTPEAKPWQAYGVPANPMEESAMMRGLRGANVALTRGGYGLKGLFSDLTPEERAKLEAGEAYMQEAGFAPKVGKFATEVAEYAGGPATAGLKGLALRTGQAVGTGYALSPEEREFNAAMAGAGQLGGEGLLGLTGQAIRGVTATPAAKAMMEKGIVPTVGQALGKPYKWIEDIASSLPLVRPSAMEAQERGMESFTKASLQSIVDDLNRGVPEDVTSIAANGARTTVPQMRVNVDIEPGAKGFKDVKQAVSNAYTRIVENSSGEMTPEFQQGIEGVRELASVLPEERRRQLDNIIADIYRRFESGKRTGGEQLKIIDSKLGNLSNQYSKVGGDEGFIGDAAQELRDQLHKMIASQDEGAALALKNANNAWFKVKTMEKAMTSSVGDELATPASLLQALRQKNRAQFATGTMPMQEFATQAQQVLGGKLPNSFSGERLGMQDVFAAGIAGLPIAGGMYGAGKAYYSPAVQRRLVESTIAEPGLRRLLAADLARSTAPFAGTLGSVYAQQR